MNGKTILNMNSPVSQSPEAVQQLIAAFNHGQVPEQMPPAVRLSAEMVLVRSNKGDFYYVTTPRACSCPSATYRPGKPCKHQRKYFPQPKAEAARVEAKSLISGPFRPFLESDSGRQQKAGVV